MSIFAQTFRTIVLPDLRRQIRAHALMVACEFTSVGELHHRIMDNANQRGANLLPDHTVHGLEQWISSTILREMWRYVPAVSEAQRRGEVPWVYALQTLRLEDGEVAELDIPCPSTT